MTGCDGTGDCGFAPCPHDKFPLQPGDVVDEAWLRETFPDAVFVGWPEEDDDDTTPAAG